MFLQLYETTYDGVQFLSRSDSLNMILPWRNEGKNKTFCKNTTFFKNVIHSELIYVLTGGSLISTTTSHNAQFYLTAVFFFQLKTTADPIGFFSLCVCRQVDKASLPFLYVWSASLQGKDAELVWGTQCYLDMQFPSRPTRISLHSTEKMQS